MYKKWIIGILGACVVFLIFLFIKADPLVAPTLTDHTSVDLDQPQVVSATLEKKQFDTPGGALSTARLSERTLEQQLLYTRTLLQYQGRSIHFGADCRAVPATLTARNGTRILIDNQSDEQKDIYLGQEHFTIDPHTFIVTNFYTAGILTIGCDRDKNAGTVIVQE